MSTIWRNWGRNQTAVPADVVRPAEEADLQAIVGRGVAEQRSIKVVGSGHSFTDIACTDGLLVDVSGLDGVLDVDRERKQVTVGAGTVLGTLNRRLAELGLALPNLGDIDAQTIAGATATGTHGTGSGFQCISAAIVGARITTGDGSMLDVSAAHRPEVLAAAKVGLGALGIVSRLTLQCVPAFALHAVESTHDIDEVLDIFDDTATTNDHVEFYWFPHTRTGQLKVNNRTDAPVARRSKPRAFWNDELLSNAGFEVLNRLGRRFPAAIGPVVRAAMKPGDRFEYIAPSHEVFCSPRRVRFVEMEYAVPRGHLLEAFQRVRDHIDQLGQPISFPIEVRVLGADDIPLSTASGRETGYIACHVYRGTSHEAYFAGVERIMADYDGRPHWGKLHRQSAETLAPLYPQWDAFQAVLDDVDPDGHFTNAYLDRVLRPARFRKR